MIIYYLVVVYIFVEKNSSSNDFFLKPRFNLAA
jgi:hypothetical protein